MPINRLVAHTSLEPDEVRLSGEFFADKRISWHRAIEAQTMAHGQSAKRLGWCSPALCLLFPAQVALVNGQTRRCNTSSLLYFRRNKVPISAEWGRRWDTTGKAKEIGN